VVVPAAQLAGPVGADRLAALGRCQPRPIAAEVTPVPRNREECSLRGAIPVGDGRACATDSPRDSLRHPKTHTDLFVQRLQIVR
jgi:hypothetical protein